VDMGEISSDEKEFFMTACGMLGWLAMTARPDVKYAHSRISQHMATPRKGALKAVIHAVKYCSSTKTACLFQPYGEHAEWGFFSDSDHAGNAEVQNKRRSQLGYIAMWGRAPIAYGSKASGVSFDTASLEAQAKAQDVRDTSNKAEPEADLAFLVAEAVAEHLPTCHPMMKQLHADVSSAAAEIYAASVALSEICHLSYVADEMGMGIRLPFVLQVDNAACLAFSKDQVQRSKLRHIDARQEWVQALRDENVVVLEWVESKLNLADMFTKILEADTFEFLRSKMMVFKAIPPFP
jgi:hypothetical protein